MNYEPTARQLHARFLNWAAECRRNGHVWAYRAQLDQAIFWRTQRMTKCTGVRPEWTKLP